MPHQDAAPASWPTVSPTTTAFESRGDPLIMESFHIRPRDRPLTHYHSALVSCATATDRPRPARPLDPRVRHRRSRRGAHVEHVPPARHSQSGPRPARRQWRYGRTLRRTATMTGAAVLVSLVLPSGMGAAAPRKPAPDLQRLVARARTLANQINSLDEQYNGLRVQLIQARAEAQVAQRTYAQDIVRLSAGKLSIGQLAAQSYMNSGLNTSLAILTSSNPQNLISRAAIIQQLQAENG